MTDELRIVTRMMGKLRAILYDSGTDPVSRYRVAKILDDCRRLEIELKEKAERQGVKE